MMRRPARIVLAAGLVLGVAASVFVPIAVASRNSSGTYVLPPGNPVVPGTPISSSWANSTLADIANEVTSSLDRQGRGAMAAPLQLQPGGGTVVAPALTISGDPNTGIYQDAADSLTVTTGGGAVQTWTLTGTSVTGTLGATGNASVGGTLSVDGGTTIGGTLEVTGSAFVGGGALPSADVPGLTLRNSTDQSRTFWEDGRGTVGNKVGRLIYDSGAGLGVPGWQFQVANDSGGFVAAGLTVHRSGGIKIGANGASISTSLAGTLSFDFGAIAQDGCQTENLPLNGVTSDGVCTVSMQPDIVVYWVDCLVQVNNTVIVRVCTSVAGGVNPSANTYRVRVWQP